MILADANVDRHLIDPLRDAGFKTFSVKESMPGASDKSIVEFSQSPVRIILTNDKDFGNWVFAHHIRNISVVLLPYRFNERRKMFKVVIDFFKDQKDSLTGKFTTITVNKIRSVSLL